jgi:hypothetical protein
MPNLSCSVAQRQPVFAAEASSQAASGCALLHVLATPALAWRRAPAI